MDPESQNEVASQGKMEHVMDMEESVETNMGSNVENGEGFIPALKSVVETTKPSKSDESSEAPSTPRVERTVSKSYLIPYPEARTFGKWQTILLAYQTLGVVYGDIGTSPLYTFSGIKMENIDEQDILGILSLIYWSLTMIALFKYVFIVIRADDHGEGGTFALYSLLCQYVNVGQNAGQQFQRMASDSRLTFFRSKNYSRKVNNKTKQLLEENPIAQTSLLLVVMIGTSLVIGDGALTPAISVLSAVQGIKSQNPQITQGTVVGVSAAILLLLFFCQRFGTGKVSFLFSPITIVWFVSNAMIGIYNIAKYNPGTFKAFDPYFIIRFFSKHGKIAWMQLGTVVLSITGAEAMFADLGHFDRRSIQIAFSTMVYPSLILAYTGQAAYLMKNPKDIDKVFYKSIPQPVYWPIFVIATLAAIVASQALISATYSIIKQSMALGCFPRVKIVHTSQNNEGRIYCPEINYAIMFLCLAILLGFRDGTAIGNAYGVAVIGVMLITTCLVTLVMLVIWNMHILFVLPFFITFVAIEGAYLSAVLNKVPEGGWVPFVIAALFFTIMFSWNYGRQKKYKHLTERKISPNELQELVANVRCRVPGVCILCSDLVRGLPPILRHYVNNVGSLHEVLIILTIRIVPVKRVLSEERFLVGKLGPKGVYRCLAQYGYMDVPSMEGYEFVNQVIESIKEHIKLREAHDVVSSDDAYEEFQQLELAKNVGTVYVLGKTTLQTSSSTGAFENFVISNLYNFLDQNCRSAISTFSVPPAKLLQVGMLYDI